MPDLHLPSFIAGALLDPKKRLVCGRRWGKAAAAEAINAAITEAQQPEDRPALPSE